MAATSNAASVASRISQHAKANPSSSGALNKAFREAVKSARAAPVAAERRGLAESGFTMCGYLGDNVKCGVALTAGSCSRKPGCVWYEDSCSYPLSEADTEALATAMTPVMVQALTCSFISDLTTCNATDNCEANAACNPPEDFIEAQFPDDALMSVFLYHVAKCGAIESSSTCNAQDDCVMVASTCEVAEETQRSVEAWAITQCDLDESIADGAGAMVAQDVDLCPVAKAQIECMQITTEAACDAATKCEWFDPDSSEDPYEKRYPCAAKDEHMEPMVEVLEANMAVALRAFGECANEYTSESACEGDEECEWNGDDSVCEANDLKFYRALGNVHPHFARYYQIDATCSAFGQSACGTGDSANKCTWSAASVGGDASCVPTIKTFAEVMSCECSTEIAAAAPTVDTSSADCTAPEVPEWLSVDDSAASCVAGSAFVATAAATLAAFA